MIGQLVIGSALMFATIVVQVAFMAFAARMIRRHRGFFQRPYLFIKQSAALGAAALWLLLSMTIAVWIWSIYFYEAGALKDLETSVYFALVSFTTLGFGDIILEKEHRLLSGLIAANGLIIFGLTTAFLIEFMQRLWQAQSEASPPD